MGVVCWGAAACVTPHPEPPPVPSPTPPLQVEKAQRKTQPIPPPPPVEPVADRQIIQEPEEPPPYPGTPSMGQLRALQEYIETPLWEPDAAQSRLEQLASTLEKAGYTHHHTMKLVRDAYPLTMPTQKRMKGALVEMTPKTASKRPYAVYLPSDYTPERVWPLHVTLHGGSASGFNCRVYWNTERRPKHLQGMIVLCPSTPRGHFHSTRGESDMLAALHHTLRHYNVDTDRVSLDGLSTGGTAAWILGAKHAPRWRTVTVRGGGSILTPRIKGNGYPSFHNLAQVPVLILHGAE
ncbi:MAG: hypothetical protein AAFS10_15205, partial [Myxococcota bacterium]